MQSMTDELRKAMREYLDISGVSQGELAEAIGKHPMQVSKTLRGVDGKLSDIWDLMLKATGMKLVMLPLDTEIKALDVVKSKAFELRGKPERLKDVEEASE